MEQNETFHKYITKSMTVDKYCCSEKFELSFAGSSFGEVRRTVLRIPQIPSTQRLHHHAHHPQIVGPLKDVVMYL